MIGLYPHFLPSELRQNLTLPTSPPTFTGEDLKKGTEYLIKYLTQVRETLHCNLLSLLMQLRYTEQQNLQQLMARMDTKEEIPQHFADEKRKSISTLQLVDTTLLKCYIKVSACHSLLSSSLLLLLLLLFLLLFLLFLLLLLL